jgi:lysophospholipase L1-like esterase
MAAAFFSDQMVRQMAGPTGPAQGQVSSRFVHAGVGHGGVRALVRKTCLTGDWGREMAYAHADAAAAPGPGMTSLVAKRPGATLALDLRDAQGQARHTRLQLLHHGEGSGSTRLAISVDGEAETQLTLAATTGPQAVALSTDAPLSTLQIRVLEGAFRFQGLKLAEPVSPTASTGGNTSALHLDLFAYPGATVAGWVRSDLGYLASWFTDQPYDLALIAFGTNEGNDPRFNETAYRDTLNQALGNFRQVFAQTQCVLIGPGDRGIRVLKTKTAKGGKKQATPKPTQQGKPPKNSKPLKGQEGKTAQRAKANASSSAKPGPSAPAANLLKYSRIHAQIGQIQTELAAQHGCLAWSMQEAMGGVGSAYPWARKSPALMAPDLIHFTPAGYRELANTFMADFGLTPP